MKTKAECSPEEYERYVSFYFATVDTLTEAAVKYETLEMLAPTVSERYRCRAYRLQAIADVELLKSKRRAFFSEGAFVRPPSAKVVQASIERLEALANVLAAEARVEAVFAIATNSLKAFSRIYVV